jgi:exodeoxyribonuclease VII small subunit
LQPEINRQRQKKLGRGRPPGGGRTKFSGLHGRIELVVKNKSSVMRFSCPAPLTPRWTPSKFYFNFADVPNPSKSAGQGVSAKNPPFEEALKKLESVVEAMESDELPLETLLAKYEEGTKLVKICQEKLAEAEVKIQQLEKGADGEIRLKPMAADLSEE